MVRSDEWIYSSNHLHVVPISYRISALLAIGVIPIKKKNWNSWIISCYKNKKANHLRRSKSKNHLHYPECGERHVQSNKGCNKLWLFAIKAINALNR